MKRKGFTPLEIKRYKQLLCSKHRFLTGFTLVELMMASAVTAVALLGLLGVFSGCFGVDESARDLTAAMNGARQIMEQLRTFRDEARITRDPSRDDFPADFQTEINNFRNNGIPNWGILHRVSIDIISDGSDPDGMSEVWGGSADTETLFWISVSVSWMQGGGRIYGEDNGAGGGVALDGAIGGAEDVNNNGILDSPAQVTTLMRE
ncbi:MAG: type II secretion system protein [Candidatus Omnitrophica bacterium]|nr:type II secretion system protein [Candidatus Omnitrophota bacterium]